MTRIILFIFGLLGWAAPLFAFPLDGAALTGIQRLEGYRLAQQGKIPGNRVPKGAQLTLDQVDLRLTDRPDFLLPPSDPDLKRRIVALLGNEADRYSISVLDLSDPARPRYAEHNAEITRNPGSVGKLMVALALFQEMADLYPDDTAARERVLHNSMVTADGFIHTDHHTVPFWHPERMRMKRRPLREGDTANLWTFLDWMLSASSNAAASMVEEQVMLLHHFGRAYPVSRSEADAYFNHTSRSQLRDDLLSALLEPISRNGLDPDKLRQGSFFSHEGKRRVPGTNSIATTRELMRYLVLMEQGKLVDRWSSLQIKRLIYMTQHRIRYASSPALRDAAVYFKSGSLYRCKPEPGFVCRKYHGNKDNLMNSVAIVEWPAGHPRLYYMVTLTSNVLRKNSAVVHQTLATRLHALMRSLHPDAVQE